MLRVKAWTLNDVAEKSFEVFTREETVQCRPRDNLIDKIALSLDYKRRYIKESFVLLRKFVKIAV